MRKYIFICFLGIFFSCKNQKENEIVDIKRNEKEKVVEVKVKDSLLFDQEGKIIGVSHLENNVREGFSLIFDEKKHTPKYLVEYNEGKRNKIIIEFYDEGKIKSFRSADISSDSQKMKFHDNGVIQSIGNTIKGRGEGRWYYFDKEGKLTEEIIYEEGQVVD
ncbi:toxin-antitoxin system YwqK family antitoxin [Zunongwangia profunda]|uniref:hypothetical protein n=1 Tax=Zunongwangia profunda TaxID=398743 RepID=UPI001D17E1C5|nr:hypothetical protein [Zunongwangia profunda]MCC4231034.1 hypothetical protein [Zunongwangia profunda]|tara:strand:+ start:55 stop:540 length:486 start_codon:yes stop_codon:yes gene_type:complete